MLDNAIYEHLVLVRAQFVAENKRIWWISFDGTKSFYLLKISFILLKLSVKSFDLSFLFLTEIFRINESEKRKEKFSTWIAFSNASILALLSVSF